MLKVLKAIVGDPNERELKRLRRVVDVINALEPQVRLLSDEQLRAKKGEFKERLARGETLDDLLPEAFAVVREAARRTIGLRHYDVQLIGGIVLHEGKIAEMKTGEGKTLVATLPLYLNALEGKGAHLVTPNDYLSKYGVQWMGPVYHALGMSVGVIQSAAADPSKGSFVYDPEYISDDERYQHLRPVSRREAYLADITYGTNNEFGFDYLRDNMVYDLSQCVQRELHYAIVDEVDNILIDEARTPLIISGQADPPSENYKIFARIVRHLKPSSPESVEADEPDGDYVVDEQTRTVTLTEAGIEKVEQLLSNEIGDKVENLYDHKYAEYLPYLDNALRAQVIYKRDHDYIVQNGQVIIVDEFTGRLMYGRRFSEGLHQAIEAKEGVDIRRENLVIATITFQNYFRMYQKLAGMTGTAATESEEFAKIYGLDVVVVPTYKPVIRQDLEDLVFVTERAKFKAVVEEIKRRHAKGQPILVGTTAIETSERLSKLLKREGIPHQVLNAKRHEYEARIIAQAGRSGAVTIATNMAGRGVDILLGGNPEGIAREKLRKKGIEITEATPKQWEKALEEARRECEKDREKVIAAGGLHVLGTERHEARRIDNQLRGRAGRQGDPGSSQFYLSLEDDLMQRFGGDRIRKLMSRADLPEDMPLTHKLVSKAIEQAQIRVEGYNFDIRKRVLEYDDVVNKQREVIYAQRRRILEETDLKSRILRMVDDEIDALIGEYLPGDDPYEWDVKTLAHEAHKLFAGLEQIEPDDLEGLKPDEIREKLVGASRRAYAKVEDKFGGEMRKVERYVMLKAVDDLWVRHLTELDMLREGIGLRAYAQMDPLVAYKTEAYQMWNQLLAEIQSQIAHKIYESGAARAPEPRLFPDVRARHPAAPRPAGNGRRATRPVAAARTAGGIDPNDPKWNVGRNEKCPCGSGKKFKDCHWRQIQELRVTVPIDTVSRGGKRRRRRRR